MHSSSEPGRPRIGIVAWIGRVWLCLADCVLRGAVVNRGWVFGILLVAGLVAFEFFNFSTTEIALTDLMGATPFLGLSVTTVLAFAFCTIDFAGLARLFTPESKSERVEVWYLTGAWFLGATANAVMTWWAVSLLMLNRPAGSALLSREQLLIYVPVFIAVVVWVTRVCLISTFALAGPRLFAAPEVEARPAKVEAAGLPAAPAGERALVLRPLGRGRARPRKEPEVLASVPPRGNGSGEGGPNINLN